MAMWFSSRAIGAGAICSPVNPLSTLTGSRIYADNPHVSSVGLRKGVREIVGKGWFRCTKSPREITVYVEVQRKIGGSLWSTIAGDSQPFNNPPAGKKSKEVPVGLGACPDGTFRTRARASGTDEVGNRVESTEWSYSGEATDPCK
jgi:hypothetical protein